jgi:hypothetical protein
MTIFSKGAKPLRAIFAAAALAIAGAAPATANASGSSASWAAWSAWMSLTAAAAARRSSTVTVTQQPEPQQQAQPQPQQIYYPYYYPQSDEDYFANCDLEHSGLTRVGIGMVLTETEEGLVFLHTQEGGPADRAGIRPGDLLVSIDGKPVESISQAQAKISGEAGTEIVLTLKRPGEAAPLKLHIKRGLLDHWQCTVPLYEAAAHGDTITTRKLLQKGARPTAAMLDDAVQAGNRYTAIALMDYGAKPTEAMLADAARTDNGPLADALIKYGALPTTQMLDEAVHQEVPLDRYDRFWAMSKKLLANGAQPTDQMVEFSLRRGNEDLACDLMDRMDRVNWRYVSNCTDAIRNPGLTLGGGLGLIFLLGIGGLAWCEWDSRSGERALKARKQKTPTNDKGA